MCIPPPTVDCLISLVTVAASYQNHQADIPEREWGGSSCYRRVKDGECAERTTLPPHSTSALALPPAQGTSMACMLVQIQRNYLGCGITARESSEGWPLSTLSWWDPRLPQSSFLVVWNQSGNDGGEKGEDVFRPDLEGAQPPRLIPC